MAFKNQPQLLVLGAPVSFQLALEYLPEESQIISSLNEISQVDYAFVFVTQKIEIQEFATACRDKLSADAIIWMCYPKGSSKKYRCEFNRDQG
ncbi:MAG: hypothetical protein ACKOWQ_07680 [Aquirufa sp.]